MCPIINTFGYNQSQSSLYWGSGEGTNNPWGYSWYDNRQYNSNDIHGVFMKLTLISFNLCPFVQRAAMVLELAEQPYDIEFIQLSDPPQWFKDISPLGKVPLLVVETDSGKTVLFESQIIADWLADELSLPLYATDPLEKAAQRAWNEFASDLLSAQYGLSMAKTKHTYQSNLDYLKGRLTFASDFVKGPYFGGEKISMPDIAFATIFWRQQFFEKHFNVGLYEGLPVIDAWQKKLCELPMTKRAVIEDFEEVLLADGRRVETVLYQRA